MGENNSKSHWYSRGYLPHFDDGVQSQFVTIRLFDSMPQVVLDRWRKELEQESLEKMEAILRRRIEYYLDQGYGSCFLKNQDIAKMIQNALLFHDSEKYKLSAWVVMPNHVHILLTQYNGFSLSDVAHAIKSYTANEANKILKREGRFWQKEPFDRYIRDGKHFANVVAYIENNPVKARLCKEPSDWVYSSAWFKARSEDWLARNYYY
jgi:putative DNA methylase